MLAQWTGEVVGTMHIYGITAKQLADKIEWTDKYLSMILNGKREPKGAEKIIKDALRELIEEQIQKHKK